MHLFLKRRTAKEGTMLKKISKFILVGIFFVGIGFFALLMKQCTDEQINATKTTVNQPPSKPVAEAFGLESISYKTAKAISKGAAIGADMPCGWGKCYDYPLKTTPYSQDIETLESGEVICKSFLVRPKTGTQFCCMGRFDDPCSATDEWAHCFVTNISEYIPGKTYQPGPLPMEAKTICAARIHNSFACFDKSLKVTGCGMVPAK